MILGLAVLVALSFLMDLVDRFRRIRKLFEGRMSDIPLF